MLITAAVVPGPPAFVTELMGSAAHELDDLRDATDRVVSRALSDLVVASDGSTSLGSSLSFGSHLGSHPDPDSDSDSHTDSHTDSDRRSGSGSVQLVIVGPGPPGEFNATGSVSFGSFGRDVVLPALVEGEPGDRELPTPIMVARYLASRDIAVHPEHAELWTTARWITTSGLEAATLGEQLRDDAVIVGLIVVADGAACHGPKAPRAQDERAQTYDEGVCAALAAGEPSRLAQIDLALGDELGASGSKVWPTLVAAAGARAAEGKGPAENLGAAETLGAAEGVGAVADPAIPSGAEMSGEVFWTGAPYGVGWAVASWRRSCQ